MSSASHPRPPTELDQPLEVAPTDWKPSHVYQVLTALVIPRPIGWISTFGPDGVRNLAPHSYFNIVAHDPPHLVFSAVTENDTLRNIRHSGEFVVNIATTEQVEALNYSSTDFPADEDEFTWSGLHAEPAVAVNAPRVAEAPGHLECRLVQEIPAGNGRLVLAEIVHIHVDPRVWKDGRVDPVLLDPVTRLGGMGFGRLGEVFDLPRPNWARDVQGTAPGETMPRR